MWSLHHVDVLRRRAVRAAGYPRVVAGERMPVGRHDGGARRGAGIPRQGLTLVLFKYFSAQFQHLVG